MTFNPTRYETIYGFQTLDELHNFLPELLYDNMMFRENELAAYFRHRVDALFHDTYVRQQNLYNLYQANQRRVDYLHWRAAANLANREAEAAASLIRMAAADTSAATPTLNVPLTPGESPTAAALAEMTMTPVRRRPHTPVQPPAPQRRRRSPNLLDLMAIRSDTMDDISPTRIDWGANPFAAWRFNFNTNASDLTNLMFSDVIVHPTAEQLAAGSTIISHSSVDADVNCAVCQEHTNEERPDGDWRRLHCSHMFHSQCIDPWFERNVHCPVCRADVRV